MPTTLPILQPTPEPIDHYPGRWWHRDGDRVVCDLCPRACALKTGDRGFCFVRQNIDGEMMLTTFGRSTGFCIDPIEKKPLNHFLPGTSVLSFGTAGCNLGCKFCQNWDISKSREVERLSEEATPEAIAEAARTLGCASVAFTYNDPVIWAEYAIETARACRAVGVRSVAVTAGYITPSARPEFYSVMDAANVDLKAFTEDFYHKVTSSHLEPVLETLRWLRHESNVWFEITNLIIPQLNDSADELRQLCDWVLTNVGDSVPIHFTAFHPDYRLRDRGQTPTETLIQAREIARGIGLKYVYIGNVDDVTRQSTYCPACNELLIERNWYQLGHYALKDDRCEHCGELIAGRFADQPGDWGRRRVPVDMRSFPHLTSTGPKASSSMSQISRTPVRLDLTETERDVLIKAAGQCVVAAVRQESEDLTEALGELSQRTVHGVYVTLKRQEKLRGCCGFVGRSSSLADGLADAAYRTVNDDPRFPRVSTIELPYLDMDITLLGPAEQIEGTSHGARFNAITIGRHGLRIQVGDTGGLLLPGVAVENGWDAEEFLDQVCIKAGLPPTTWRDPKSQLTRFEGTSYSGSVVPAADAEAYADGSTGVLTEEQLGQFLQAYGRALATMAAGMATMSYFPNLPDMNVNGVAMSIRQQERGLHWTASRVNIQGLLPLQSTLFSLCQDMAQQLQRSAVVGEIGLDLTILTEPAMHGTVEQPDLRGISSPTASEIRSVMVTERGKSGWMFDPSRSVINQMTQLASTIGVSDPSSANVLSLRTVSTIRPIAVTSVPRPVRGPEVRSPAVAGQFYPADPDRMDNMLEELIGESLADPGRERVSAVMVPHAGWRYSGRIAAAVLRRVAFPKRVIAIGPKHTTHGTDWAVAPHRTWSLPGRDVASDLILARRLAERIDGLEMDSAAHREEHGIEVELPIIARLAPETKVVGIAIGGGTRERLDAFAEGLAEVISGLDEPPLLLISTDMNHFANDEQTRRLDELALEELDRLNPDGLFEVTQRYHISMCGMRSAVIVLKTLRRLGLLNRAERVGYGTTADVTGERGRVVGYAGMIFS